MSEGERRLAAIMYTDIVGYTALTQSNEVQAMVVLERHNGLLRPFFPRFHGREVKALGDGFLVEFDNALDAVRCAAEIQSYLHDYNLSSRDEWKIKLRIGIHLGDVIRKGGDVFGDAVNIASRIQPIAAPEGICVSEQVYYQVQNKLDMPMVSLGEKSLKNVSTPMEVYAMRMPWEKEATTVTASFPMNRIAILPFVSMSTSPDDAFFADGVTEEIISTASGISGLEVISRTSVMGYKGTTKKVKEIGKELEVGSVLEGSFRKAGNRIRVTTQLIDVVRDKHLWAQNYDRNLDDVFEVQSDVAKQVADALRIRILSLEKERIERKPTESAAAYTLYLKGRSLWNTRGLEDLKKGMEYFEQAVHEDPSFALGYVGISDCCENLRSTWGIEREANLTKAEAMANKALELDPQLAEAHASKAMRLFGVYNLRKAEEEFKMALELKPSYSMAHMWYSFLLGAQRRWEESQEQIEKALELDPLSPIIHSNLGAIFLWRRNYDKAIESYRRAIELGFTLAHGNLAYAYGMMKKFDDAKREGAAWVELRKDTGPLAQLNADLLAAELQDDKEKVGRLLHEAEAHFQDQRETSALDIASYHFYLGELDEGFDWLERSYSKREFHLLEIASLPEMDGVRTDPRYLDLLKRLGLEQTSESTSRG